MKTLTQNETARIKAGEPMATRSSDRPEVKDQYKLGIPEKSNQPGTFI
jgi:hypothetical protein